MLEDHKRREERRDQEATVDCPSERLESESVPKPKAATTADGDEATADGPRENQEAVSTCCYYQLLYRSYANRAIAYWYQLCDKVVQYNREGKRCCTAYIDGFANCQKEQFWEAAYDELKREHACYAEFDRPEKEMKILAYIR